MQRRRRANHAPQLSSLFRAELGHELPERLSWRGELAALSRLETARPGLRPTCFDGTANTAVSNRHRSRYSYVSQLVASPDGALLAAAAKDARLELHELGDDPGGSLRLTLEPEDDGLKSFDLSAIAWAAPGGADSIIMGFSNRPAVWLFDLATCSVQKPTRQFPLSQGRTYDGAFSQGASDVVTIDNDCFAACTNPGDLKLFDVRATKSKNSMIGTFTTEMKDAVVAAQGMHIYAAGHGDILMYDRRMSRTARGGGSVKSFGGKSSSLKKQDSLTKNAIPDEHRVTFLRALPGAAPGCVAYQTTAGAVGYMDMAVPGPNGAHLPEEIPAMMRSANIETSLDVFGTAEQQAVSRSWYMSRRQCHVMVGQRGRGWKMIAPVVQRSGIRVVSFGPGFETRNVKILRGKDYACVHAPSPAMDKFVLGGAIDRLESLEANFDRRDDEEETEDAV